MKAVYSPTQKVSKGKQPRKMRGNFFVLRSCMPGSRIHVKDTLNPKTLMHAPEPPRWLIELPGSVEQLEP